MKRKLRLPRIVACTVVGLTALAASCDGGEESHPVICVESGADAGPPDGGCPTGEVASQEDCPAGCEPIVV